MKRIVCLFCLCLMLCGCGKETEPAEQAAMPTAPPETTTAVVSRGGWVVDMAGASVG